MATQIELGARLKIDSTGSDRVEKQIEGLEKELVDLGTTGDKATQQWLKSMIHLAKVGKEVIGTLEKIGNAKISIDPNALANFQSGIQTAVEAGITNGIKNALTASQAGKIASASTANTAQGSAKEQKNTTDLTTSINRLEQTISSFAITLGRQAQGSNIQERIQEVTGRPQFVPFQELGEIATRNEGKAIRGAANEIVLLLGQAEQTIEQKKQEVRELVKAIKTKIDIKELTAGINLSPADVGSSFGAANVDIISEELLSSIGQKLNVEMLSDVDQMMQMFETGFAKAKKNGYDGMSLLLDGQKRWLSETEAGQKLMAQMAIQFFRSKNTDITKLSLPVIQNLETPQQEGPFDAAKFKSDLGDGQDANEIRTMLGLVEQLFKTYEDVEATKLSISQVDKQGNDVSSNNLQRLERMLAMNRDQLALAKENNSVSVRYNTILEQNNNLLSRGVDALNTAVANNDLAQIAVLQREYSNQQQKSVNLEKQLQQLIERNRNLQQGSLGQLKRELDDISTRYLNMGSNIGRVTSAIMAQDKARSASGGTPQFGGFISGLKASLGGLDEILAPFANGNKIASTMLGGNFSGALAAGLKTAMRKAMDVAAQDPELAGAMANQFEEVSSRIFEFASATQGAEGIDSQMTASLLEMATELKAVSTRAQEARAGVDLYSEGLTNAITRQAAVRESSASVEEVLKRVRSQFRVGDESSRIIERIQRQSQRVSSEVAQTLSESQTVMASLNKPLALFDRDVVANAKSFLETMKNVNRASEQNVASLQEGRRLSLADIDEQGSRAKAGSSSTMFAGLSGAELDAKIAETKAKYNSYYDDLIAEAAESSKEMSNLVNRSFADIQSKVQLGTAYNTVADGLDRVKLKIEGLSNQYNILNASQSRQSSALIMNAQDMKQLTADASSLSREIRQLEANERALIAEMTKLSKDGKDPFKEMGEDGKLLTSRLAEVRKEIESIVFAQDKMNEIRFDPENISRQQIAGSLEKNRSSGDRLIGSIDTRDVQSQIRSISAQAASMDINQIANSVNDFKALKAQLSSTFAEASKGIAVYQGLIARGVELDKTDMKYLQTLQGVKAQTSALIGEMAKQEGSMKTAEMRLKANTQSFDDYSASVYQGVKSQVDFAIGAGALTAVVGSMGMAFRELITESRELSRTLTVLQSNILSTEEVSKIAYEQARELSVQYGMTIGSVADVAKELGSAGMKLEEVNRAWEDTLRAINATNAETTQVTRAVAGIYNVYRQELKETGNEMNEVGIITDTLTSIFQNHQAEMDEIVQGYKFVVGTGKTAGFTFQEMGSYLAVLNDNMIKSGMAGRGLQTVFAQTAAKTDQLAKMFNIKLDPSKTIASQFNSLLEQMNDRIGGVEVSARDMNKIFQIFDREGARAFTTLVQQYPAVKKALHETQNAAAGVTGEMNRIINQSLDRRFFQMKQALLNVARDGFDAVKPAMIAFLDMIKGSAKLFANFNSAMGGIVTKVGAYGMAIMAALTVSRTLIALLNGAIGTKLLGSLSSIQTAFLNSSTAGREFIKSQAEVNELMARRAQIQATLKASDAAMSAPTIVGRARDLEANKAILSPSMKAAAQEQIASLNREIDGVRSKASGIGAAFSSAFALAAPMLFIGALITIGSEIDKIQNRTQMLTEQLDKSKGELARINNELFRLRDSESSINKVMKAFNSGFMGAAQAGRAVRDVIDGLGKDAQLEFIDLAGMSDEQIAKNAMQIEQRLTQFRIAQIKKVEATRVKEQESGFAKQAEIMRRNFVKISSIDNKDSGFQQMGKSAAEDFIKAYEQSDQFDPRMFLSFAKFVTKGVGAAAMAGANAIGGDDSVAASSGQDPKKIRDQYEAIAAVLDGNKKREDDIVKLREAGLKLLQEEANTWAGGRMSSGARSAREEIERLQAVVGGDITTPDQKRLFEEMIGDFQKWRSQSRLAGESTAFFEGQLRAFLSNSQELGGMALPLEQVEGIFKRLKEQDIDTILVPDVATRNSFEALTGEVQRFRESLNWQGSTGAFDMISNSAIVAGKDIDMLAEAQENLLQQMVGLEPANPFAFKRDDLSPNVLSKLQEFEVTGMSRVRFQDSNTLIQQQADALADSVSNEALQQRLEAANLTVEIPVGLDLQVNNDSQKALREQLAANIKKEMERVIYSASTDISKFATGELPMSSLVMADAKKALQILKSVASTSTKPETATGTVRAGAQLFAGSERSANLGDAKNKVMDFFVGDNGEGLEQQAFRLAEINSLLKKQNELAGITNKRNQDLKTSTESIKQLNQNQTLQLGPTLNKQLSETKLTEKERLKLLIDINKELSKQVADIQKSTEGGKELTEQDQKKLEALKQTEKALKDEVDNRNAQIAKNREIQIQLETERNSLKEKAQLLAQQMIFLTDGYAMSVRTSAIERSRLDSTLRELMVSRQLLGLKKKEGEQIRTIADLYNLVSRDQGKSFRSGKESVAAMSKLIEGNMTLISRQRKLLDDYAASSKMLIETIGVTEAIIGGDDESSYAKATKQIYDMLARLPEIDAIERKILKVKEDQAFRQEELVAGSEKYNAIQIESEDQLIILYAKKAKLLQEMAQSQKAISKSLKEQLVDDKRPELYQAAADALKQFQEPLEKETASRLSSLFEKDELGTAMGIQATTGDPLMFILNDREEAMKRFMVAAKEGRVNFNALSSSIQNTLEPQLKAYQEMLQYEGKLKQSYIDRAKKVGNNLSQSVASGDFSRANGLFSTLQGSILELTKKTGNEMLTVMASEKLIEINELMLEAEAFQKVMMEKQLDLLNVNMEELQALFKTEAQKIQAILLKTMGANPFDVEAALAGQLDVRNEMAESSLEMELGNLSDQIGMLTYVINTFAQKQGISVADMVMGSESMAQAVDNYRKSREEEERKAQGAIAGKSAEIRANLPSEDEYNAAKEKKARNEREIAMNKAARQLIADQIGKLNESLVNWAENIQDTRVQAEAYSQALRIIDAGGAKAEETIQKLGSTLLAAKEAANPTWKLLTGLADAFKSVNEVVFSLLPNLGDISYAVENAATYISYLEAIDEATRTYIASVEETTTALKRNETGYYDYINAIQDAEKQRYEELMAAEAQYREDLKKTQDIFKESFLAPMKEAIGSMLSEKMGGIGDAASALFGTGLNKAAFGLSALGISAEIGEVETPELKAATKIVDSNAELVAVNKEVITSLDNMKAAYEGVKADRKSGVAGAIGAGVGLVRKNDSGVSFAGQVTEGIAKMSIGLMGTVLSGAVAAFGSVIGMAFDATISNQTQYLLKFVEKFARELPQMITGFVESFQDFFPKLVDTLVNDVLPNLIDTLVEVLPILVTTIATTFIQNLGPFVTNIVNGIQKVAGPLLKAVIGAVTDLLPALIDIVPKLSELLPTLVVEGVSAILKNLPKIIFATLMAAISIALLPIELIMGAIRAIVKFFGGDIEGFSILKYIAKATKAGVDGIPTFHEGGKVPGAGEKSAVLLGGEGVLNKRAMAILGEGGLNRLNKGYAPVAKAYGALGASQSSKMTQPSSLRKEGRYEAPTQSTINMGGITINAQGADRKAVEYLSDEFVIDVEAKLAKRQSNRASRLNKG